MNSNESTKSYRMTLEEVAEEWASACLREPILVSASIHPSLSSVTAKYTQRDPTTESRLNFEVSYVAPDFVSAGQHPTSSKRFVSPSGKFHAEVSSDDEGTTFRVWENERFMKVWVVPKHIHGELYEDATFQGFSWGVNEDYFVYVANRPSVTKVDNGVNPKQKWKLKLEPTYDEDSRAPLGEGFRNFRRPGLFVGHIGKEKSWPLVDYESWMFGDPQCGRSGIVATARSLARDGNVDMDLAPLYCYNRSVKLVLIELPSETDESPRMFRILSDDAPEDHGCHSPRIRCPGEMAPDIVEEVVYLVAPGSADPQKALTHNTTMILRYVTIWKNGQVSKPITLIPLPEDPKADEFPGLYILKLARNPWLNLDTIVLSSIWGSAYRMLSFVFQREATGLTGVREIRYWNSKGGNLISHPYTPDAYANLNEENVSLHDTEKGNLLFSKCSPASPISLYVGTSDCDGHHSVKQVTLRQSPKNPLLVTTTHSLVATDIQRPDADQFVAASFNSAVHEAHTRFEVTHMSCGREKTLIVYPHGGPHVNNINCYTVTKSAILKLGFGILHVNYRGSLGLGQKSLETLPGNVGTQDVIEVAQATRWAMKEFSYKDVSFVGGSHSGFLGAHLSLLNLYRRVVLRNPVVDLTSMMGTTDIPDWCFAESGAEINQGYRPTPEVNGMLYKVSPVARLDTAVKLGRAPSPTLLQVGGSDRRVPPAQALLWRRSVNAVWPGTVQMRWYANSGHALAEVPEGDDSWVCALKFLIDGNAEDESARV